MNTQPAQCSYPNHNKHLRDEVESIFESFETPPYILVQFIAEIMHLWTNMLQQRYQQPVE